MKHIYTEDENDYLRSYLNDHETKDLKNASEFLGIPVPNIRNHISYMRKNDDNYWHSLNRRFTEKEDNLIKNRYGIWSYSKIANALNRSPQTIYQRVKFLNLDLKSKKIAEYGQQIRDLAKKGSHKAEISRQLNLQQSSVSRYTLENEIKCGKVKPCWKCWELLDRKIEEARENEIN